MLVSTLLSSSKAIHAFVDYNSNTMGDKNFSYTRLLFSNKFNLNFSNTGKCTEVKMRVKISANSTSSNINSGFGNYHLSIWGDYFLNYNSNDQFLVNFFFLQFIYVYTYTFVS